MPAGAYNCQAVRELVQPAVIRAFALCVAALLGTAYAAASEPLRVAEDVYDFASLADCRVVVHTGDGFLE